MSWAFYFGIGRAASGVDINLYSSDTVGTEPYGSESTDIFRFSTASGELVNGLIYLPTSTIAKNATMGFERRGFHRVSAKSQGSVFQVACADCLRINKSSEVFGMFVEVRPRGAIEKYELAPGFSLLLDSNFSYCGFSIEHILERIVLSNGRSVSVTPSSEETATLFELNEMLGDDFWWEHDEIDAAKLIISYIKLKMAGLMTKEIKDLFNQCADDMQSRFLDH